MPVDGVSNESNKIPYYHNNIETPWTKSINPIKKNMQSKTEE